MKVITSITLDSALAYNINLLLKNGVREDSRNGPVWTYPEPVSNVYLSPKTCVLFNPARDANPFFHIFEAMWMLAGRNDVAPLARLAANMASYSVDGGTFNAAYGYRWRRHFGVDQLLEVVDKLKRSPGTRQAVMNIWCPEDDLVDAENNAKDRACNLSVVFTPRTRDGKPELDMMVSNRSNDAVFGALGANAVHFSFLHAFVSEAAGIPIGRYTQVSANLHMYGAGLYGAKLFENLTKTNEIGETRINESSFHALTNESGELVTVDADAYSTQDKVALNDWFDFSDGVAATLSEIEALADYDYEGQTLILKSLSGTEALDSLNTSSSPTNFNKSKSAMIRLASGLLDAHCLYKAGHKVEALTLLEKSEDTLFDCLVYDHHEGCTSKQDPGLLGINLLTEDEKHEVYHHALLPQSPCQIDWFHAAHTWIQRRLST